MIITLKDGSTKEYSEPKSIIEIAADISEGLARMACAGEVNGEVEDLRTVIDKDCNLSILTFNDEGGKAAFRHTTSHIMAQAIKRLYPDTKLAIGPSIADGFYYDVDRDTPLTSEDLEKIEAEMKKIVKEDLKLERFELPRAEAIAFMKEKEEPYKVELIEDLPEDAVISFYRQGEFTDLCAGPHLMSTKPVKAAGAGDGQGKFPHLAAQGLQLPVRQLRYRLPAGYARRLAQQGQRKAIVPPDVRFGYPCFAGEGKEIFGQRYVCCSTHWLGERPISLAKARERLAAF